MRNISWITIQILTLFKTCSLEDRIILWSESNSDLTNGGMGLQQAKIPCISFGNTSHICNNMCFGRTNLNKKTTIKTWWITIKVIKCIYIFSIIKLDRYCYAILIPSWYTKKFEVGRNS